VVGCITVIATRCPLFGYLTYWLLCITQLLDYTLIYLLVVPIHWHCITLVVIPTITLLVGCWLLYLLLLVFIGLLYYWVDSCCCLFYLLFAITLLVLFVVVGLIVTYMAVPHVDLTLLRYICLPHVPLPAPRSLICCYVVYDFGYAWRYTRTLLWPLYVRVTYILAVVTLPLVLLLRLAICVHTFVTLRCVVHFVVYVATLYVCCFVRYVWHTFPPLTFGCYGYCPSYPLVGRYLIALHCLVGYLQPPSPFTLCYLLLHTVDLLYWLPCCCTLLLLLLIYLGLLVKFLHTLIVTYIAPLLVWLLCGLPTSFDCYDSGYWLCYLTLFILLCYITWLYTLYCG